MFHIQTKENAYTVTVGNINANIPHQHSVKYKLILEIKLQHANRSTQIFTPSSSTGSGGFSTQQKHVFQRIMHAIIKANRNTHSKLGLLFN